MMRPSFARERRGTALVAALVVTASVASAALAATLSAREALAAARNRMAIAQATWRAEGCGAEVRAELGGLLQAAERRGIVELRHRWNELGAELANVRRPTIGCAVSLRASGTIVSEADLILDQIGRAHV